jgi:hypothetical protein
MRRPGSSGERKKSPRPSEEGGRALEHPRLGFGAEDPSKQPVVGELALQIDELGMLLAGTLAKVIPDSLAERSWGGVPPLGHR